jgi:site-specific DNA-methyltransferase (adenine-specific)
VHEYVLVFCKEDFRREKCDKHNTISNQDFVEWTKSIWRFGTESAKRVGHPAPFPIELPKRFIELYTFAGDVVLDPFCGSGTTCVGAMQSGRNYVGYDISNEYAHLAAGRIEQIKGQLRQGNLHFGKEWEAELTLGMLPESYDNPSEEWFP